MLIGLQVQVYQRFACDLQYADHFSGEGRSHMRESLKLAILSSELAVNKEAMAMALGF